MRYQYPEPDPQHVPILEEIAALDHFNNLHLHLPGARSWYEGIYANKIAKLGEDKVSSDTRQLPRLWRAIDDFVAETGFDVPAFMARFRHGQSDKAIHDQAQLELCPLYIYLRAKGFSQKRIIQ